MRSRFRSLVATAAIPFLLLTGTPADAAKADVGIMQGSGTFSPGLGAVPEDQAVEFTGTFTAIGTDGILATYPCDFAGTELSGNVGGGIGTLAGSCGPIDLSLCVYVRVGPIWVWICVDAVIEVGSFYCVFTPDDTLPTTSYDLVCTVWWGKAP